MGLGLEWGARVRATIRVWNGKRIRALSQQQGYIAETMGASIVHKNGSIV